jgi:hypothetical protein
MKLTTILGENITLGVSDAGATVNGVPIVATDILANNGLIHKIDNVMVPKAALDILNPPDEGTGPATAPTVSGSPKARIATALLSLMGAAILS